MSRPYSTDLRERVVAAVLSGSKYPEAAERFAVSLASVSRWVSKHRREGTVEPGAFGGHKTPVLAAHEAKVRALVASEPDLTLNAMVLHLARDGVQVSCTTVHRFLNSLGLTRKKRRSGRPSRIARMSPKPVTPGTPGKPS